MQQGDNYAKKLDFEKRRNADLDACITRLQAMHKEAKVKLSKSSTQAPILLKKNCSLDKDTAKSSDNVTTSITQGRGIPILENRLDKLIVRYNDMCNSNRKMRDTVQSLRREKVQQHSIQVKLEREANQKQSETSKLTSAIQSAYEARDRANRQVEALEQQKLEEIRDFQFSWSERKAEIEQTRNIIPELTKMKLKKSPTRLNQEQQAVSSNQAYKENAISTDYENTSSRSTTGRNDTIPTGQLIAEKENELGRQTERLRTVEIGLAKVEKMTGLKSPEELARALTAAEEQNFSFFNMINELNAEMEALEIENHRLESMLELCKGAGGTEAHRMGLKQQLEGQIEKSKQKVLHFESRHAESSEIAEVLKSGALSILHKIGTSDEAFLQQLQSSGVTEENTIKLLGFIEHRIGELVNLHNITTGNYNSQNAMILMDSSRKFRGQKSAEGTNKAGTTQGVGQFRPRPPTANDFTESDTEEQDDRPYKITDISKRKSRAKK
ncbi:unnamed protein product [Albugo candida]|nr:unnamed protein product [Albugo candida]|eukprot:CCI47270.1 unnamed protein product [Albugo candida]